MRLTVKNREGVTVEPDYEFHYLQNNICCNDRVQKLGQLEDIEKELGIDLLTLFQALKEGIYTIHSHGERLDPCLAYDRVIGYILDFQYEPEVECILSDYGKTWALTKEELEGE